MTVTEYVRPNGEKVYHSLPVVGKLPEGCEASFEVIGHHSEGTKTVCVTVNNGKEDIFIDVVITDKPAQAALQVLNKLVSRDD